MHNLNRKHIRHNFGAIISLQKCSSSNSNGFLQRSKCIKNALIFVSILKSKKGSCSAVMLFLLLNSPVVVVFQMSMHLNHVVSILTSIVAKEAIIRAYFGH